MNYGSELLKVLALQRGTFVRKADGTKLVTNPQLYFLLDQEAYRLQVIIGKENKRVMLQEKPLPRKYECHT